MYRPGQTQPQQTQGQGAQYQDQAISNVGALPFPLEAVIDETGEPVTLLQTCDWKGHSPSNIGVDKNGKQFIAAFGELTVTDHRAVPNTSLNNIRSRRLQQ